MAFTTPTRSYGDQCTENAPKPTVSSPPSPAGTTHVAVVIGVASVVTDTVVASTGVAIVVARSAASYAACSAACAATHASYAV